MEQRRQTIKGQNGMSFDHLIYWILEQLIEYCALPLSLRSLSEER